MSYLEQLLHPITKKDFFNLYYEKKHLLIQKRPKDIYHNLLTIEDIDHFFQRKHLPFDDITLTKGLKLMEGAWTNLVPKTITKKRFLLREFNNGSSIILNSLSENLPKLNRFIYRLNQEIKATCQTNVYITPAQSQAFPPHFDTHDVLILQIFGNKDWTLYNSPITLPDTIQKQKVQVNESDVSLKCTLNPGDLLYIPRGLIHEALTQQHLSIHLTLGIHPIRGIDMIEHLQKKLILSELYRKTVPSEFPVSFEQQFKSQLLEIIKSTNFQTIYQDIIKDNLSKQSTNNYENTFKNTTLKKLINGNSTIQLKDYLQPSLEMASPMILLHYQNKKATFPIFFKPDLERIISGKAIKVASFENASSELDKIKLATQLVDWGITDIVAIE